MVLRYLHFAGGKSCQYRIFISSENILKRIRGNKITFRQVKSETFHHHQSHTTGNLKECISSKSTVNAEERAEMQEGIKSKENGKAAGLLVTREYNVIQQYSIKNGEFLILSSLKQNRFIFH